MWRCAITAVIGCGPACDIFGNAGGDWVGYIADQAGQSGNMAVDPEFCSTTPDDDYYWALQSDSPCATAGCGLIGAGVVDCGSTAAEPTTWGEIKASFR